MGDLLALPTARGRPVRAARIDYANPPSNVTVHPVHAERLRAAAEPDPRVRAATVDRTLLLALLAHLDARERASGGSRGLMLSLMQNAHRFAEPEVERAAVFLTGDLWDQLAREHREAAREAREPQS